MWLQSIGNDLKWILFIIKGSMSLKVCIHTKIEYLANASNLVTKELWCKRIIQVIILLIILSS